MVNELLGAILFGAALAFLIDSLLERLRGDATNAIVVFLCIPPPPLPTLLYALPVPSS